MSPNLTGALLMMASMACFTISDAAVKATAGALPLPQLMTLRTAATGLFLLALAHRLGALKFDLPRRDWWLIALRCLGEVGAAYFFITALLNLPLANLTAIIQALPLTLTLAAALVFREPVGWRRMLAILIGFAGVLLIVRPGGAGFNIYGVYGLAAVACVTLRDLATRRLSAQVPSLMVTFMTAVSVLTVFGLAALRVEWAPMTPRLGGLVLLSSVFIMGGYLCSVAVMRVGDVSFVAPFRYTGLIWALLLGWAVFGHWPEPLTLIGAGIVVATGLFTLYRERATLRG